MKLAVLALVFAAGLTGCAGPYFKNQAQYDGKENWVGWANPHEVARMNQERTATNKLAALPASMGYINEKGQTVPVTITSGKTAPAGFMGKVANLSSTRRLKFAVYGPEEKSWYLGPGQIVPDYLPDGNYIGRIFYGSSEIQAPIPFKVGSQRKNFMGEEVHWYFGSEY